MGQKWDNDKHGVLIEYEGSLAHIPPDEYEIDTTCPDCGEDTLEGNCDCWTWDYSDGFDE